MDWECRERYTHKRECERQYNKEWADEMIREGFLDPDLDADNNGESWYEWRCKQDALEEREKEMQARSQGRPDGNSNNQHPRTPDSTGFPSSPHLPPTGSDPIYPSSAISNTRTNPGSSSPLPLHKVIQPPN
jgi:hypothetical protein